MPVTLTSTGIQFSDSTTQSTAAGAAKVLQTVSTTTSTEVNVTSSFADSGITATITPTSASNKILILISTNVASGSPSASNYPSGNYRVLRGASVILGPLSKDLIKTWALTSGSGTETLAVASLSVGYVDSPATTSATTYKLQGSASNNLRFQWGGGPGTIILMEVAP